MDRRYEYAGELRGMTPPQPGSLQAGPPTHDRVWSCQECAALVMGAAGRERHDRWHAAGS